MVFPTIVAFDLETTGRDTVKNEMLEIGAVKFSIEDQGGQAVPVKVEEFQTFVKPNGPLNEEAQKVNHITEEMVANAPRPAKVLESFTKFVGDATCMVAHNAPFDMGFLNTGYSKHAGGNAPTIPVFDSLVLARSLLQLPTYKLGEIAATFKKRGEISFNPNEGDMHRAVYDCEMLMHVFVATLRTKMTLEDFAIENFMAAIKTKAGANASVLKPKILKQPKLF
jgi:DNA polymerase III epsilon subunit family exonuclease